MEMVARRYRGLYDLPCWTVSYILCWTVKEDKNKIEVVNDASSTHFFIFLFFYNLTFFLFFIFSGDRGHRRGLVPPPETRAAFRDSGRHWGLGSLRLCLRGLLVFASGLSRSLPLDTLAASGESGCLHHICLCHISCSLL